MGLGILGFYFDPMGPLPATIKKGMGWTSDQNNIMLIFNLAVSAKQKKQKKQMRHEVKE